MKKHVLIFCLVTVSFNLSAENIPVFKEGERVAFVGNSITCGGRYHSFIWLYYMTHFPDMRIDIYNEGIGGDLVQQMSQRMDKVFEHNPSVVTLSFGMNDVGYMDFTLPGNDTVGHRNVKNALDDYQLMEKILKRYPEVKKIFIGSSPYDETSGFNKVPFPGKNKLIVEISDFLKQRALSNKWNFIDFTRQMVEINKREQRTDSAFTLCGRDRIHPSTDGHLVMAYLFLKAQGLANKPVADVYIDASNNEVVRAENCRVSDLSTTPQMLSFTYLANSLPFPIDSSYYDNELHNQADALKVIPFMDEMNHEGLTVTGLSDGSYLLKIGGKDIARFTALELKKGINLASYGNTPQYEQAKHVALLNEQRWLIEREMREYYWMEYHLMRKTGMLWKGNDAAVDTLLKYRKTDPFVDWNHKHWVYFKNKSIRENSIVEQQDLTNRIYLENRPVALKVALIRL
jgi:Lysophospholipase L1 and related esterases